MVFSGVTVKNERAANIELQLVAEKRTREPGAHGKLREAGHSAASEAVVPSSPALQERRMSQHRNFLAIVDSQHRHDRQFAEQPEPPSVFSSILRDIGGGTISLRAIREAAYAKFLQEFNWTDPTPEAVAELQLLRHEIDPDDKITRMFAPR